MQKLQHKPWMIAVIVMTLILLILTIFISTSPQLEAVRDTGLFQNDIGNLSDKYSLTITPPDWTFGIWAVIFSFQAIWVVYGHTLICRKNRSGTGYLYYDPPFLSVTTYVLYMLNLILNIVWIFSFDQEYLGASFVALIGAVFCMTLTLLFATRDVYKFEPRLRKADVWFNVLFVHNAMGIYAAWLGIATLLGLGIVLKYHADASDTVASVIPVVIIFAFILVYYILDILVFKVQARYVFGPYVVWIFALSGIIDKHYDPDDRVQVTVVALLGLTLLFVIVKVFVTMYRAIRHPLTFET